MDFNYRAGLVLVKVQDLPCGTRAPSEPVAEKKLEVPADEVDDVRGKAHVLDSSVWFTKFLAARARHVYLTDDPVFSQGEPANAVFYIQCGEVRLTARSPDRERRSSPFFPKAVSWAKAVWPVRHSQRHGEREPAQQIVRIEKQTMTELLHSDPEFAERFLIYTPPAASAWKMIWLIIFNSSEGRLARMQS